jgi:Protein of unknown function (DUF4242)
MYNGISAILSQPHFTSTLEQLEQEVVRLEVPMEDVMKKYIIEREIPNVGSLDPEQVRKAAAKSNQALRDLGPDIQWQESFVAADKTFCVYLAKDEAIIHRHAELSGFPASKVTQIGNVIGPATGAQPGDGSPGNARG